MGTKTKKKPQTKFELEQGVTKIIEVVGTRPENQPYIWIGSDSDFFGSLHEKDMRALRDAIDRALDDEDD